MIKEIQSKENEERWGYSQMMLLRLTVEMKFQAKAV